jgi:hypothetical protein
MQATETKSDLEEMRKLNEKADTMNMLGIRWKRQVLLCGAKRKRADARCRNLAGAGTNHLGYGRCKFCGGASTGPKTDDGKAAVSQNGRIHGFYASTLDTEGREIFDALAQEQRVDLEFEIYRLKAQIIQHLKKWSGKNASRRGVVEGTLGAEEYYIAGTIEDRPYIRALETLSRLVRHHARLNPENGNDLLGEINAELRAASKGKISISWGERMPQHILTPEQAAELRRNQAGK